MWVWAAPGAAEEAKPPAAAPAPRLEDAPVALKPKKWLSFPLIEREELTHDTRRFRFAFPLSEDGALQQLGLPIGQHVYIKGTANGKPAMRAYTPLGHGLGYVDLVIKVYFPCEEFPDGGALTMCMEKLKLGDSLQFKGPLGEYVFDASSPPAPRPATLPTFAFNKAPFAYRQLGLIAGGSGITPCLQVAAALLANPGLNVSIRILTANKTPADVLCMKELETLSADPRVEVWHTVSRRAKDDPTPWPYSSGRIDAAMLSARMPPPGDGTFVFMCGPPGMIDVACKPNLLKLGHAADKLHCF